MSTSVAALAEAMTPMDDTTQIDPSPPMSVDTLHPGGAAAGASASPEWGGQREGQPRPVQTLARAYAAICAGAEPWVALNEFFHEWFDYARDQRRALVAEPIRSSCSIRPAGPSRPARRGDSTHSLAREIPNNGRTRPTPDRTVVATGPEPGPDPKPASLGLWRWAVFCAAAAEYLCASCGIPCPSWALDPHYTLRDPWYGFGDAGASSPAVRIHLEQVTPEPLRRRNILGGDRVFATKYAAAQEAHGKNTVTTS